nr:PREDICTED: uncharacterized protein LOC109038874 isoform X2 [Bemisia tabaci]
MSSYRSNYSSYSSSYLGSRFNTVTRTYTSSGSSRSSFSSGFTPTSSSVLSLRDKYNSLSRNSTSSVGTSRTERSSSQYDSKSGSDSYSRSYSTYKPYSSTSTESSTRASSYTPYKSYTAGSSDSSSKSTYTPWSKSYRSSVPESTYSYRSRYSSKPDAEASTEKSSTYRSSYSKPEPESNSYTSSSRDVDSRSSYSRFKSDPEPTPRKDEPEVSSYSKPSSEYKPSSYSSKNETDTSSAKDSLSVYSRYGHYGTRKSPAPSASEESKDEVKVSVTTRYTSPTPPSNSAYLRNRRAELESIYQCEIVRKSRVSKTDCQTQTDENDIYAAMKSESSEGENSEPAEPPLAASRSPVHISKSDVDVNQNIKESESFNYVRPTDITSKTVITVDSSLDPARGVHPSTEESLFAPSTFQYTSSYPNLKNSSTVSSHPNSLSVSTAILNLPNKSPTFSESDVSEKQSSPDGSLSAGKASFEKFPSPEKISEDSKNSAASKEGYKSSSSPSFGLEKAVPNQKCSLKSSSPARSPSPNSRLSRSRSPTPSYSFTISPRHHQTRSKDSSASQTNEFSVAQPEILDKSSSYHLNIPSAFQLNLEKKMSDPSRSLSRSPSPSPARGRTPENINYSSLNDPNQPSAGRLLSLAKSTSFVSKKAEYIEPVVSVPFKSTHRFSEQFSDSDISRSETSVPKIRLATYPSDSEEPYRKDTKGCSSERVPEKPIKTSESDSLSFNGPPSSTSQSPFPQEECASKPPVHPASPIVGIRVSSKERMESLRYAMMRSETPAMAFKNKSFESSSEDISDLTFDFSGKHYVINEFTENHIPNARKPLESINNEKPKEGDSFSQTEGMGQAQSQKIRKFDSGERDWWARDDTQSESFRHSSRHDSTEPPNDSSKEFSYHGAQSESMSPDGTKYPSQHHIRKFDSGERDWWAQNEPGRDAPSESPQNDIQHDSSNDSSGEFSNHEAQSRSVSPDYPKQSSQHHIRKFDSGEREWWLEDERNSGSVEGALDEDEAVENEEEEVDFWAELAAENEKHELELQHAYQLRNMDVDSSSWWIEEKTKDGDRDNQPSSGISRRTPEEDEANADEYYDAEADNSAHERNEEIYSYSIRKFDSGETPWFAEQENDDQTDKRPGSDSCQDQNQVESGIWSMETFDSTSNRPSEQFLIRTGSGHTLWYAADKSEPPVELANNERFFKIGEGERMCWIDDNTLSHTYSGSATEQPWFPDKTLSEDQVEGPYKIKRIESGEKPWWLDEDEKTDAGFDDTLCSHFRGSESRSENNVTRADLSSKASDGEEDLEPFSRVVRRVPNPTLFISELTNIDQLLGDELSFSNQCLEPTFAKIKDDGPASEDEDEIEEVSADQVKIHDNTPQTYIIEPFKGILKLDDAALQLYKDGDYSSYLDLDATISEQQEEFEGFQSNRKNSIVLRTQLSVRVHTIIEKLLNSEGSELRRALFCLKQIFQEDKDLVHEFVQNDGLSCLIKVGSDANQNYQNYILRALGQVMLYVDGMNGVIEHNETIQWLYCLVSSKFRLVVKTALKLLLVFVEYVESNCLLLIQAIHTVDKSRGSLPWSNIMKLLNEYDVTDTELLIYAMTLINKTLNRVPDLDMYYDQVDEIEKQGIQEIVQRYMSRPGTDLDFLHQLQSYEAVLNHEDGGDKTIPLKQLDDNVRTTRFSNASMISDIERRRSRRHSTGTVPLSLSVSPYNKANEDYHLKQAAEDGVGVTPALRRRLERGDRQKLLIPQEELCKSSTENYSSDDGGMKNGLKSELSNGDLKYYNGETESCLPRENTVKDLTQRLATLNSPNEESPTKLTPPPRVGEMKGIISKAIEGLAKSQSKSELKSPTNETPPMRIPEVKKSETELHWEELLASTTRALQLCDLDFTDLGSDDEKNILAPTSVANGIPPPPPPCVLPPPAPAAPLQSLTKTKKTVKLFWKEVCEDPIVMAKMNSSLIWDELTPVPVDTQKLEHLFESRTKDLITKKQHELNKNKEIIVLDPKRSNAINIGMTKLPPPRAIKTAILKMDATVMNREGIEKLLTMLPSEEERTKIQEAQTANPELPLGSAEQFLLTLASIIELPARLKLWAFKLDYENSEKEIAEPLMDLKQGMELLKANKTFRAILATLLSIGIFLNGNEVKGFQIEYLAKVPEVKDTVHKHSLLHHLCHMVMSKFPQSTDLYSEIGAVTRASKVDFDELALSIHRMEQECKASFDHLKVIVKHDGSNAMKGKMSDFLADCAERIIVLCKVHRRVINRYHKFCLWLGIPLHRVCLTKPNELCRIISEFALEYRTTRERVLQQLEKKANHRERNKTRGKMITEIGKVDTKEDRADAELRQLLGNESIDRPNSASPLHGSLPWRRQKKNSNGKGSPDQRKNGHLTDGDDELLETLVKTATKIPATRSAPRERKRIRNADRKSFRQRTLRNGLSEEDKKYLASYIESF